MSIRRTTAATLAAATAASLAVLIPASPASAAINASTSGTKLIVSLTGTSYLGFACSGGKVATVDGSGNTDVTTVATPNLACTALTEVDVTGDSGNQNVYGADLDDPAFSAKPKLVASLGDGIDGGSESLQADTLDYGPGEDFVGILPGTAPNVKLDLGAGSFDAISVGGTKADDQIALSSTNSLLTVAIKTGATTKTAKATNAKRAFAYGDDGNDTFSSTGITAASATKYVNVDGNRGNDTFTIGVVDSQTNGGEGTNTVHMGTGKDEYYTGSETDVIDSPTDGSRDLVMDYTSLRFGGRTLTGFGDVGTGYDTHAAYSADRDVTIRVRPKSGGSLETMSLNRTGQQQIPAGIDFLQNGVQNDGGVDPVHRTLVDVVMGGQDSLWSGNNNANELFDITTPTNTYGASTNGNQYTIQSGGHQVTIPASSTRIVHGPWADKQTSYAHRVNRDLLFKFLSDTDRNALATKLKGGTTTRAKVAAAIIGSDEYRGLDVDRVFVQFLRRKADAGGRTYWINSLRSGKALWRFRAQLIGSNEYFTKAGGTNAAFVTKAYNDVLGRNPDSGGKTYWTNKLNKGADRGSVALQFLSSTEARRNIVKDQYLRFLDRTPTTAQADAWIATLGSTTTGEQDLIESLVTSTEYYDRN